MLRVNLGNMRARRPLRLVAGLLILATSVHVASAQPAPALPRLAVNPPVGRPGDAYYLSGGGFPKSHSPYSIQLTLACRNILITTYGRWPFSLEVRKDGTFAGVKEITPTPLGTRDTQPCQLYAALGVNSAAVQTDFTILASDAAPPGTIYPVHSKAELTANGDTVKETLKVKFLPGAAMHYKVKFPGTKAMTYSSELPWTGKQTYHWQVRYRVRRPTHVHVSVSGSLGRLHSQSGSGSTWVWVRP